MFNIKVRGPIKQAIGKPLLYQQSCRKYLLLHHFVNCRHCSRMRTQFGMVFLQRVIFLFTCLFSAVSSLYGTGLVACAYVRRRAHKVKFIKIFKTSSSRYENVANAWAKRLSQRCHKIYIKQAEMLFVYP